MKKAIIGAGRELLQSGLTVETWGNISLFDRKNGRIYITPSNVDYFACGEEDVVVLSPRGEVLEGTRRPSSETPLHLAVYARRPDVSAIVHTHPVWSTVFSCMGEGLPVFLDEAAQTLGGPVPVCPYALPGTQALAEACADALAAGQNACLLRAHGAVCVGKDLKSAFRAARVLEMTAEIAWRMRALDAVPRPLAPEDIAAMRGMR